jgi:hypothetical protein
MVFQEEPPLNLQFILAVAAGGAFGAVGRYLTGIGAGNCSEANFPGAPSSSMSPALS